MSDYEITTQSDFEEFDLNDFNLEDDDFDYVNDF